MKKTMIRDGLILICLPLLTLMGGRAIGQDYNRSLEPLLFGRQPSARAEAMGKSMVAGKTDGFGAFYNPASIGQNKGLVLSASYTSPYYLLPEANYKFIGTAYEIGKYGVLGLSLYHFDYGEEFNNSPNAANETYSPSISMYSLTYSTEILEDFHAGANFNYARQKFDISFDFYPVDLGLLKVFRFNKVAVQKVTAGASLYNVTNSTAEYNPVLLNPQDSVALTLSLPRTLHLGASYEAVFGKSRITSTELNTVGILLQAEYQDVLNSRFYDGIKAGAELSLVDMIYLRFGFYDVDRDDYDLPESNKGKITDITYGFGVVIPVSKFSSMKLPIDVRFDMTSLKQPSGLRSFDDFDNFSSYNLSVNWQLKN